MSKKRRPPEHVRAQREGKERDEYMCAFCHKQVTDEERYLIQGHHIIQYAEDGPATKDNIITLCKECHDDYHAGKLNIDISAF